MPTGRIKKKVHRANSEMDLAGLGHAQEGWGRLMLVTGLFPGKLEDDEYKLKIEKESFGVRFKFKFNLYTHKLKLRETEGNCREVRAGVLI